MGRCWYLIVHGVGIWARKSYKRCDWRAGTRKWGICKKKGMVGRWEERGQCTWPRCWYLFPTIGFSLSVEFLMLVFISCDEHDVIEKSQLVGGLNWVWGLIGNIAHYLIYFRRLLQSPPTRTWPPGPSAWPWETMSIKVRHPYRWFE